MSSASISAFPRTDQHQQLHEQGADSLDCGDAITSTTIDPNHLLSPFSYYAFRQNSSSASPSFLTSSTPAELTSDNGGFSDLSDFEDEFFGVDFDANESFVDFSLPNQGNNSSLNITIPPAVESQHKQSSATKDLSKKYPPSPILTTSPSTRTTSPRPEVNDSSTLGKLNNSDIEPAINGAIHFPYNWDTKPDPLVVRTTPDSSRSSRTSDEGRHTIMDFPVDQIPTSRNSLWNHREAQANSDISTSHGQHSAPQQYAVKQSTNSSIPTTLMEGFRSRTAAKAYSLQPHPQMFQPRPTVAEPARTGVDPEKRRNISSSQIPSIKDQEKERQLSAKKAEVDEWRSQANDLSDGEEESTKPFSRSGLQPPIAPNRLRAKSTSAVSQPPTGFALKVLQAPNHAQGGFHNSADNDGITPLPDYEEPRENKLDDGQLYYDTKATEITAEDLTAVAEPSRWQPDAPRLPWISNTRMQADTANDAINQWNQNADTFSLSSRAATWGTRRKSETNLADLEGGFLKRLTISKPLPRERPRQGSVFEGGLNRFTSIVRNKSDAKLKRTRTDSSQNSEGSGQTRKDSQGSSSLAPPPRTSSFGRNKKTPSLSNQIAAMAVSMSAVGNSHVRNGSISATPVTSPRSPAGPFNFANRVLQRARSRSDIRMQSGQDDAPNEGLYGLLREHGGPPVPTLSTPLGQSVESLGRQPESDENIGAENEDDDDDARHDDNKLKFSQSSIPIIPTYSGFRENIQLLNPDIQHTYLVDRIAHQQVVRYKSLLECRVTHLGHVRDQTCPSGQHCKKAGGTYTLLEPRDRGQDVSSTRTGLQIDTDLRDDDPTAGDGALQPDTFPPGVPMPPPTHLPAEFECELCFSVKKFQKPSDWTKHVQEDVQPFTCTYANCKDTKAFKRKADWVRHENELHRHLEWWTCEVDDCTHKCYRKDNFLQHLVREHKYPDPKEKTKAAVKRASGAEKRVWLMLEKCHHVTTNLPRDEPCKFCGAEFTTWKKLTVHLAKHMEQIALPVLKLVDQREVEHDTIISPVEAQQIQAFPLAPELMQKTESMSSAPLSMGNITPIVPVSQFSSSPYEDPLFYNVDPIDQAALGFNMTSMSPAPQDTLFGQSIYSSGSPFANTMATTQHLNQQRAQYLSQQQQQQQHLSQSRGFATVGPSYVSEAEQQQQATYQTYPTMQQMTLGSVGVGDGVGTYATNSHPPTMATYHHQTHPMMTVHHQDNGQFAAYQQQQQQQQKSQPHLCPHQQPPSPNARGYPHPDDAGRMQRSASNAEYAHQGLSEFTYPPQEQ